MLRWRAAAALAVAVLALTTPFSADAQVALGKDDPNCRTVVGRKALLDARQKQATADGSIKDYERQAEGLSAQPGATPVTVDDQLRQSVVFYCGSELSLSGVETPMQAPSWTFSIAPKYPDWIVKSGEFGCDVKWNQDCEWEKVVKVSDLIPGGAKWQVCKFTYGVVSKDRNNGHKVEPAGFVGDKHQRTGRYTDIYVYVRANGSHKLNDRYGAEVILSDLHVWAVPLNMTDADRKAYGCVMYKSPPPPPPKPPPKPPKPDSKPAQFQAIESADHRFYRFRLFNDSDVETVMACRVWVRDEFFQSDIEEYRNEWIVVPARGEFVSPDLSNNDTKVGDTNVCM